MSPRQEGREAGGVAQLFSLAFASATRNLLAEPGFHRIVVSPRATSVAAAPASIRLVGVTRSSAPIASGIETVQRAVVTVRGGDGHGSGFYVGNDGDVVTNHHVVGSARRVKLRHHDGRELDGAAVATDDWRDVALVRAAAAASQPLPVLRDIPPAGAEVYAVRSPLAARLQSTVTRGIVSSLRRIEGLSMIQSDVAIQPGNSGGPLLDARGNVVGIAVAGHRRAAGLNFFIPIGDALDRLGVVME